MCVDTEERLDINRGLFVQIILHQTFICRSYMNIADLGEYVCRRKRNYGVPWSLPTAQKIVAINPTAQADPSLFTC
jgi:hypothetical protein